MSQRGKEDARGSAVILALSLLIVISIMAGAALRVASVQSKVARAHNQAEVLRQAAEGGIQVARSVVMNYIAARQDLPVFDDIYLDNGIKVEISCQPRVIKGRKVLVVTSRAFGSQAGSTVSKAIQAQILSEGLPAYAVQAESLKVSGWYRATVSQKPIDDMQQDWSVSLTERRLEGDAQYPQGYPCQGPCYPGCTEATKLNHPLFSIYEQEWPGLNYPDHTWQVSYEYGCLEGKGFHILDDSLITITPFYEPYGYLEVLDEKNREELLALSLGWDNTVGTAEELLFTDDLTSPVWGKAMSEENYQAQIIQELIKSRAEVIYPLRNFNPQDFIKTGHLVSHLGSPDIPGELWDDYRNLAQDHSSWQYIPGNGPQLKFQDGIYRVDMEQLDSTLVFIDRPPGDTIELDFNSLLKGLPLSKWLEGPGNRFFDLVENGSHPIIVIANANIHLILDSVVFKNLNADPAIFMLSGGDIKVTLDPVDLEHIAESRHILAFLLAARDLHIISRVSECHYSGVIYAGKQIYLMLSAEGTESEPRLIIQKSARIFRLFPHSWVYLNMAPIIAYSFLD